MEQYCIKEKRLKKFITYEKLIIKILTHDIDVCEI